MVEKIVTNKNKPLIADKSDRAIKGAGVTYVE